MRVLVIGAYGFIGSAIISALLEAGHRVGGLGRSVEAARRRFPEVEWIARDLRRLLRPEDWMPCLAGYDAVVNAAGVLQDGAHDDVGLVQSAAMHALFAACEKSGPNRLVQISAVGADGRASTLFMRSKAEADAALAGLRLDWVILRPGVVIGSQAYGGTALLRGLAALPLVIPVAVPDAAVQTVDLAEVAEAVVLALEGRIPARRSYDLVEDEPHRLADVVLALRAWLGLAPAPVVGVPPMAARAVCRVGDLLGRLGWRPPLRTTALLALEASVTGDPTAWKAVAGRPLRPLDATLRHLPASVQERWFARLWLLKPVTIAALSAFWLVSGLIGLARIDAAASVLSDTGVSLAASYAVVLLGALIDIALGIAILVRSTSQAAAGGMAVLSALYLAGATVLAPSLWIDPLGPLVKVVPGLVLALVAAAISEGR
jgi:uncharacterized protein YbjT (DUF2867 family)